ncbi:MAG: hypothetical protein WCO94_07250 [Verrucomicrobiota bacterium]
MNLDLRIPIGILFLTLGGLLAAFGLLSLGSPIYERSLGINVNLWWGILLLVFGGGMLFPALRNRKK